MENLFGTIGTHEPSYLLASNVLTDAIGVSMEPGNGTVPAGAVIYRKTGVLYAPATTSDIAANKNLLVLRDDVDTTTNAGVAVAAAAYRQGKFIAGKVLYNNSGTYEAITAAHAIVLRGQNIELSPMDNWDEDAVVADNRVALTVTVTAGSNGSATADKATAKKGEKVTLTITPASTYVMDEIEVTEGGVTLDLADGVYSFIMGDEEVEIVVTFKADA